MTTKIGLTTNDRGITGLQLSISDNPVVMIALREYTARSGLFGRIKKRRVRRLTTCSVAGQVDLPDGWSYFWRVDVVDGNKLRLEVPLTDPAAQVPYMAVLISPEMSFPKAFRVFTDRLVAIFDLPAGFDLDAYRGTFTFELDPIIKSAHPNPTH